MVVQGKEYGSAWELAVDNRVDLNPLVDFCWPAFLGNAAAFVQQVPGDQDQADLLAALRPGSTAAPGGLSGSLLSTAEPLEPKVSFSYRRCFRVAYSSITCNGNHQTAASSPQQSPFCPG